MSENVFSKSDWASEYESELKLVDALWGGTKAMRENLEYLPTNTKEHKDDYANRVSKTFLTNFFKKTIYGHAGRIFEDEVIVKDDAKMEEFAQNVDYEGRDIHRFAYSLATKTMRDGIRFILIDAPKAEGVKTRADEIAQGIRPYWIEIDRRQVLGFKSKGNVLTLVRILESVEEDADEFTTKIIEQVRVLEPYRVRIYRKNEKNEVFLYDEFETTMPDIGLIPVYAMQDSFMQSEPPLMDIAYLNIEHWQKSSDQSNILHYARVPIMHYAGYDASLNDDGTEKEFVIGAGSMVKNRNPSAKLEYVEHSGAAIGAGRQDLVDIEDRAHALGADFAVNKTGDIKATVRVLNEAGANSKLCAFAINLQDSLELALEYTARLFGGEFSGSVYVNRDFGISENQLTVETLLKMRVSQEIDRETFWNLFNEITGKEISGSEVGERLEDEGLGFTLPEMQEENADING